MNWRRNTSKHEGSPQHLRRRHSNTRNRWISQMSTADMHACLARKSLIIFLWRVPGIMRSILNQDHLIPLTARFIPQHRWRRQHYENGSTTWKRKGTSKRRNPTRLISYPHSSSSKRKTGNNDQCRIIEGRISSQSGIITLYLLYHPRLPQ